MGVSFTTTLLKDDTLDATGIVVPAEVIASLGGSRRPAVTVTVAGYTYRSTVASMGGQFLIPFAKEHRERSGIGPGQALEVILELDTAPRTVDVPDDLAAALEARPGARETFDRLSYTLRKEHVRQVETAKAAETRERRIARIVAGL
jgi:bifunctional DNA-binding transcriptional regulator/antitoxin component of YhaV-PrlF toxin-antitoxin module